MLHLAALQMKLIIIPAPLRPVFPQLNPLGGVAHAGVLYQGSEHHEETDT